MRWAIGSGGLTARLAACCLHPHPINAIFYGRPSLNGGGLFSGGASPLDAFRGYPRWLSCPACLLRQQVHQRPRRPVPLVLRATSPQATAHPSGRDRPVSRRSKPSSRSPLIGEQPHPWPLLQGQDGKSRHRGTKPRGRWELSPATSLLSLG